MYLRTVNQGYKMTRLILQMQSCKPFAPRPHLQPLWCSFSMYHPVLSGPEQTAKNSRLGMVAFTQSQDTYNPPRDLFPTSKPDFRAGCEQRVFQRRRRRDAVPATERLCAPSQH